MECKGCKNRLKWYHKKGGGKYPCNSSWHKNCAIAFERGYDIASKHSDDMNLMFGLPNSNELYWLHQPNPQPVDIANLRMKNFKNKYNIGIDNKIQMKNIF